MHKLEGIKKIISVTSMCLLLFMLFNIKAEAMGEERHIHIVFDNSASMVGSTNTDMANATYALQILLGMLDEEDTAVIYPVSKYQTPWTGQQEIDSKCKSSQIINNLDSVQEMIKKSIGERLALNTYFTTVMYAIEELRNENSSAEKWLVVLSDGEYEDWDEDHEVQNVTQDIIDHVLTTFMDEKYKDINIIHYSFKENRYYLSQKEIQKDFIGMNNNITFYPKEESDDGIEMLDIMIQIGNQIFERKELMRSENVGKYEFTTDVPIKRLIVLSQNRTNLSVNDKINEIGGMKFKTNVGEPENELDVNTLTDMNFYYIEDGEKKIPQYNTDLYYNGKVVIYNNFENNGLLPPGEYYIQTSGEEVDALHIYYEPEIEIGFIFKNIKTGEEQIIWDKEKEIFLTSGEYEISIELFDSINETNISEDSDIKEDVKYWFKISNEEGRVLVDEETEVWRGSLESGSYVFKADADVFPGLSPSIELQLEVSESFENVKAKLEFPEKGINIEENVNEENVLRLKIYNGEELLSEKYRDDIIITQQNSEDSFYVYRIEKKEGEWLLWPEKNTKNNVKDQEPSGRKELKLQIKYQKDNNEIILDTLNSNIFYYGNTFEIGFQTSWGEKIDFREYISGRFFNGLFIQPVINNEEINWKEIKSRELSPRISGDENSTFQVKLSEDETKWIVTPQVKINELLSLEARGKSSEKVNVNAIITRYEQREENGDEVNIDMQVSKVSVVFCILCFVFSIYCVFNILIKWIRGVGVGKIDGYIEFSGIRKRCLAIKIRKGILYNLIMPGKSIFKVYLNEITGGRGKKIIFCCRAGGVCTVKNIRECNAFSKMRINGIPMEENNIYDLEKELRIVVERDQRKVIVVYKK